MTTLMLLLVVLLKLTLAARYIKEDECEERTNCVYKYTVSGEMLNGGDVKEEMEIDAQVTLQCKSKGKFINQLVHYYCIDVENATVAIYGREEEQANGTTINQASRKEKDNARLPSSMMGHDFCFVRNELGKILSVFYPPGDKTDIVNFKKTLVSAFQVNFAKTEVEEETDSQSQHIAHYSYENNVNGSTTEHRTVGNDDVFRYSSEIESPSSETVEFLNKEDIEVNENHTIQRSHGESWTLLTKLGSEEENSDETDDGDNRDDKDVIQSIEARSHYTLELVQCQQAAEYTSGDGDQFTRLKLKADSLMTRYDEFEQDEAELQELYDTVPDLQETAHRVSRSTDKFEKDTERALSKWRRLLYLESKHGVKRGRKPAIDTLIEQLQDIMIINEKTSVTHQHLRAMIYSLLSTEGGEKSQKILISLLGGELSQDEFQNIVLAITMLPSVRLSTISALKEYLFQDSIIETKRSEQLLLAFASLGRYNNVENEVVNTIVEIMTMLNDTANNANLITSIHLIHALGNTGSKLIIPYVSPFLEMSTDMHILVTAIDALRTVATDKRVMSLFSKLLDNETDVNVAMAIVESLTFPFESYIYFPVKPKDIHVSENLIKKIVNAVIHSGNLPLLKATQRYLIYIGMELPTELQRKKRASTTVWNSASSSYNSIASYSSRQSDVTTYPVHRAYLWTKTVGPSKINAKISAGGFGGVGVSAVKALGIVKIDLYVYGKTYTGLKAEVSANIDTQRASAKLYVKVIGITLLQSNNYTSLSYTRSWSNTPLSRQMFNVKYRIWIWIGFLNFYLQGRISASVSLNLAVEIGKIETNLDAGPKFSVTGGASVTLLVIFKIGLEVDAGIGYYVTPKASANAWCDNSCPPTDATACFRIFHGSKGIDVDIYAFYQRKSCRISGWRIKCSWKSKKKLSLYSTKFTLGAALTQKLLYGNCYTSSCLSLVPNSCPSPTSPAPTYPTMRPDPWPQPAIPDGSGSGEEPHDDTSNTRVLSLYHE